MSDTPAVDRGDESTEGALAEFRRFMREERDYLASIDLTEYGRGRYEQTVKLIDRFPATPSTEEALRAENELLREMVALLTDAEKASLGFLAAHGWYTDPALVQRGKEIRAALANLSATPSTELGRAREAVIEAARELYDTISAEINPLDEHPNKCPDDAATCLTCIADKADTLCAALAHLDTTTAATEEGRDG